MKLLIPPIKIQGIKSKLVPWILELVEDWEGRWIEPFLGSGVVVFNAKPDEAILNDSNPHIIEFYRKIQSKEITPLKVREYLTKEGKKLNESKENGYEHYRFIRDRFNREFNSLDFLFLSRAGFNGMMRFNRSGEWNIPFCKKPERFRRAYVTKIVNQVNACAKVIKKSWLFTNKDFRIIIPEAKEGDLIYCDPPYLGRYVDYYNGWNENDEKELFELLKRTKARFVLSTWHHNKYRENKMFDELWNNFNFVTRDHFYHSGGNINNRKSIVEALVFNFETNIKKHNHKPKIKHLQKSLFPDSPFLQT